jgi:hypothetical protein
MLSFGRAPVSTNVTTNTGPSPVGSPVQSSPAALTPNMMSARQEIPNVGEIDCYGTAWTGGAPKTSERIQSTRTKAASLMCNR